MYRKSLTTRRRRARHIHDIKRPTKMNKKKKSERNVIFTVLHNGTDVINVGRPYRENFSES